MTSTANELSRQLAARAEAVCRRYLSKGRREGRYWLVGDVANTPGASLYVRLDGPEHGSGAAGRWRDAATGQHGDLLDLIGLTLNHHRLVDTFDEARRFLLLPEPTWTPSPDDRPPRPRSPARAQQAARRLFAASGPFADSLAQAYLRQRGLTPRHASNALRGHPSCYYRPSRTDPPDIATAWPALIASVTDLQGRQTGVHRTWLNSLTLDKAPIATPRRALGALHGHGVRFGLPSDVMAAGEGLETVLSLEPIAPDLPLVAALSSAHLAALLLQEGLKRLYILVDPDPAGRAASNVLAQRALDAGIQPLRLVAPQGDFNDALRRFGRNALAADLAAQFAAQDQNRFLRPPRAT